MAKSGMTLNDADRAILREIQHDGRMTNQALAEATAMSASACWRRVQALEESGIITGYTARVDPRQAGLEFNALVQIVLSRAVPDAVMAFSAAVATRPEVLQCLSTTGTADLVLRVVAADIEAYNRFLREFLHARPEVASVNTSVVLDVLKDSYELPL